MFIDGFVDSLRLKRMSQGSLQSGSHIDSKWSVHGTSQCYVTVCSSDEHSLCFFTHRIAQLSVFQPNHIVSKWSIHWTWQSDITVCSSSNDRVLYCSHMVLHSSLSSNRITSIANGAFTGLAKLASMYVALMACLTLFTYRATQFFQRKQDVIDC